MSFDWPEFQLSEKCTIKSSTRIFKKEYVETGIPFMRSKDVIDKALGVFSHFELFISKERYQEIKCKYGSPNEGDLLISSVGNRSGWPYIVQDEGDFYFKDGNVIWMSEFDGLDPDFLAYWLKSDIGQSVLASIMIGSAQKAITIDSLRKLWVSFPPFEYQQLSSDVLKLLDKKIASNKAINQTLEEMAQAIFQSWFVDFDPVKSKMNGEQPEGMDEATASLFPEKLVESELGELPEGWKLVPVGDLLANAIGGDWGKEVPDEKHTEEVRIVRGTDIPKLHGGAIDSVPVRYVESKKLKTRKLERGDIVIEVSGGSKDQPTGRSLFISDNILKRLDLPSEPASFCRRFKPVNYEIGLLLAVHFQLMYQAGKTWEYQNQSTGISNFQTKYFLEAEHVVIPSEDVIEAFIKQVNPMMDMIHSNQNIELAKLRDTLLPKLLSGEIELGQAQELAEVE